MEVMTRIALRPLALPPEHGAWAFLLEPIAVGLLIAPSAGGAWIAAGAIAAFLSRHPLLLALRDRENGRRYPRTAICERLGLGYAALAVLALAQVPMKALLPLAAALPLVVLHMRSSGRSVGSELAAVVAPSATVAAIALAAGVSPFTAVALWVLIAARAIAAVLFVRSALRGESRAVMLFGHVVALIVAAALSFAHIVAFGAAAAMLVLLVRALPHQRWPSARALGIRELLYGALTVVLIAVA